VGWEPTDQEIEEKLIELAYTWGDIEEEIEMAASGDDNEANFLSHVIGEAFRVEAVFGENHWADACTFYDCSMTLRRLKGARRLGKSALGESWTTDPREGAPLAHARLPQNSNGREEHAR
jgi:hypothetical protein